MLTSAYKGISNKIGKHLVFDKFEMKKLILYALSFFFIIASYSILRSLKSPIFLGFVGKEYQPATRILAVLLLFPVMLFYSRMVDKLKRHKIVYTLVGIYAILAIIFAFLFAHPIYGIKNTVTSPYRLLGWAFEIFMDLYSALIVSAFWGFINSTSTPEFANRGYGLIVATSKIGGICAPLISLYLMRHCSLHSYQSIPVITAIGGLCLLGAMLMLRLIPRKVPTEYMRGYEASYQAEVEQKKKKKKTGVFEGIKLILTQPYVLGIFGLLYSIEIISVIFEYQMLVFMSVETNNHVGSMTDYMFIYTACFQALGLFFAIFGPSTLLKKIGIRYCLLIMPVAIMLLTLLLIYSPTLATIFIIMVVLRALNYGFNYPVREMLYIPTVKDIQFKSKAWIESFGKSFSKGSGGGITWLLMTPHMGRFILSNSAFIFGISLFYLGTSFFVGRTYVSTIRNNDVIGKKE